MPDRATMQHYRRVLNLAQTIVDTGYMTPTVHSADRDWLRDITPEDAETVITGQDARVISDNPSHPEGPTYCIAGRRANGEMIHVVVAFTDDDIEKATGLRLVSVMFPERGR